MKKILYLLLIVSSFNLFAQKIPAVSKTEFSKDALYQRITSLAGKKLNIGEVLKKHKGRILIIDFWASWCKDCI